MELTRWEENLMKSLRSRSRVSLVLHVAALSLYSGRENHVEMQTISRHSGAVVTAR